MRFGHKLTLALVFALALVLSLTTVWTQERQFDRALGDARAAAQDAWQREAGDLQQAMLPDGGTTPESLAWRYVTAPALLGSGARRVAVYGGDGGLLASNLPVTMDTAEAERARPEGGELRTVTAAAMDGARYLLCGGLVVTPGDTLTLVYAHPLDELFAARGVRLRDALLAQSAALAVAAALALALCRRLVRPLEELEAASRQIAAGAYDRRTALRGGDEVASLSRSFDGMAAAVQEKVTALQQTVQQQEDFIAAFTHELKTPMTSMLGYADLLRAAEVDADTRRKAAGFIYHESKRLEALSGRLMQLSRLNGCEPPPLEPVRLDVVFRQLARALPPGAPQPVLPACRAAVLAQRELLCDLLYNLILNARHATPPEGHITVEAQETETDVTLTVRDDGCGIPAADLPRVTEPFYMVDKSRARQQGGSGMGLALCARIAQLHGTRLDLKSRPGKGTTVAFTLPKAPPAKEAADETA